MNAFENWFCASGLWSYVTRRKWLPWLLEERVSAMLCWKLARGPAPLPPNWRGARDE